MVSEEKSGKFPQGGTKKLKSKISRAMQRNPKWSGNAGRNCCGNKGMGGREMGLVNYSYPRPQEFTFTCLVCFGGPLNVPHQNSNVKTSP